MHHDSLALLIIKDLALCTHVESSFARSVHVDDTVNAVDGGTGGEVRTFYVLHVFVYRNIGHAFGAGFKDGIDVKVDRTSHLCQVVGWNTRGHTDRNTVAAVEQQVGEPCWQNRGFLLGIIEVGLEINGALVDVVKHVLGNPVQATLGVPHSGRWVAVNRTEVTLAVNEGIAKGKFLSHTDHGVVN